MGPGPIWIKKKKLENCPKIKFWVCTIRPCLAVHVAPQGLHACSIYPVFCDSIAVRLTKIMVHFTSAMLFAPVHGGCYIISIVGIEYSCGLGVM